MSPEKERNKIVSIEELSVRAGAQTLLHKMSLDIYENEILGIAGESGSGKTMLFRSLMSILPEGLSLHAGAMKLLDTELCALPVAKRRRVSGSRIGFIPQNTQEYLHPDFKIRSQILDGYLSLHKGGRAEALKKAGELLEEVGFSEPERILNSYPWQLSGGMRQRVNIAMALMHDPEILVADEPTTALDADIARQILELFLRLKQERGIAIVLISHNLPLLEKYSERIGILYAGRILELADTEEMLRSPGHPYTQALLKIVPGLKGKVERLPELPGFVPDSGRDTDRCIFASRCPRYQKGCDIPQEMRELRSGHFCRCSRASEGGGNVGNHSFHG